MIWLEHNLNERLSNPFTDFDVKLNREILKEQDFSAAATLTTFLIAEEYPKIYISLSGGIDSEFILMKYREFGLPVTPIIIKTPYNEYETAYAFHVCRTERIKPVVLEPTNDQILSLYNIVLQKLRGKGINAVYQIFSAYYSQSQGGILLVGSPAIPDDLPSIDYIEICEWDYYNDVILPGSTINFFYYTPEIFYALMNEIDDTPSTEFKSRIFNRPFRPKFRYAYTPEFIKLYTDLQKQYGIEKDKPKSLWIRNIDEIKQEMKEWLG